MAGTHVTTRVEGLSSVVRNLERMGVEVEELRAAMARVADEARPVYQGFTPVKSGRLRGDYRVGRAKGKAMLYVGRAAVPYAGPINYGWPARGIKPAGFVAKGDEVAGPKASQTLEDEISRMVERLGLA